MSRGQFGCEDQWSRPGATIGYTGSSGVYGDLPEGCVLTVREPAGYHRVFVGVTFQASLDPPYFISAGDRPRDSVVSYAGSLQIT